MSTAVTPSSPEIDRQLAREMLRNGDHLDQPTFHQYYEAAGPNFRAELIRGVVYVASPVSGSHAYFHVDCATWLRLYALGTPGTAVWDCASYVLPDDTEVQPDLSVTLKPPGLNPVTVRSPVDQHPKLVVEVAYSSRAYDLFEKKALYEQSGVEEYLVISLAQSKIHWFGLQDGAYRELQPDADQILRSKALPGLWLNVTAFFKADLAGVQETLQQGLASKAHADFVEALKRQFPSP